MTEVVRTPIGRDAQLHTRRSFDERLFVRWPGAYAALARAGSLLPPRSRLRRALLRRSVLSGWSAWTRGERMELTPQEIVDAGNPVVAFGHFRLRARGSGIVLEGRVGIARWVERGLIVRQRDFTDWEEALLAAGIPTAG